MLRKLMMGQNSKKTNLTKVNEIAIEFGQFVVEKTRGWSSSKQ